jgi:transcriptional regulator with XRE-family HTH domain
MHGKKVISSKAIGEKVKFRRQELGISQERLAELLDVSYQQVQRYENGRNRFNVENIQIVADALSVPVGYFFECDEPSRVAERTPTWKSAEESELLKLFEKIRTKDAKNTILRVARLAARAEKMEKAPTG